MPLVDNINVLDVTNAMTARSKNLRRYRVGNDQDFIDYIETVESTTYEYPRATEQAAKNAIELIKNQTTAENQTVNASMVEDVRNVESYKVIYTSTFATTTEAAVAPAPEVGGITWSRNNQTVSSWPQSITMTSANAADRIWYRIDAINSSGATVSGTFINGGSNNVTVSLNASTLAAGYNGWHKRVIIIAEVRRTQLTGEVYVGAQSSRRFTQNAPTINLNATPGGNSFDPSNFGQNMYDFPMTVVISHSVNATIELSIQQQDWASGQIVRTYSPIIVTVGSGQTHSITFTHGQPPTYYNNQSNTYWYLRLIIAATYNFEGVDYTQIIQPFYYAYRRFTS